VCDVCGEEIPKGTRYVAYRVPPKAAALLRNDDPELNVSSTIEKDGNVRLDVCLECRVNMGFTGEEAVN